ncbi:MAG: GspE/PulE family protein [Bacteroidales bacterium]|nr:GspE/PulE family protein [Bacteroidales bacterium]
MKERDQYIDTSIKQAISSKQAWYYRVVPVALESGRLELLMDRSRQINGVQKELEVVFGKQVLIKMVDESEMDEALARNYPRNEAGSTTSSIPKLISDKENFILTLIEEAGIAGSSDIHFEVQEKISRVRYRIDGNLVDKYTISSADYPAVVNAIKIKSNLDIAEKRLPQDGRILFNRNGKRLDIRVSIIPTIHGEKVVFRLLNKDTNHIDLDRVGFNSDQLGHYQNGFLRSHGLVLISGPTGSGKTTTLYATLKRLNTKDKNILTIEDPIEYTLDGINQVQLKEGIGLTFPVALRTFLRQDPDIIMVGEIRDAETAQIAIRFALTGHLVLSTIHTNSAWGIVSRLMDMGVPEFLISATLNVAVAQRLVRLLCPECKEESDRDGEMISRFMPGWEGNSYQPKGCASCNYSGFKGRKAIFEVIEMTGDLRKRIKDKNLDREPLSEEFNKQSLAMQGMQLFRHGETSFMEILPMLLNQ